MRQASRTKSGDRDVSRSSRRKSQDGKDSACNKSKDRNKSAERKNSIKRRSSSKPSQVVSSVNSDQNREHNSPRKSPEKTTKDRDDKSMSRVPCKSKEAKSKGAVKESNQEIDENCFRFEGTNAICLVCPGSRMVSRAYSIKHSKTDKHKKNVELGSKVVEPPKSKSQKKENNVSKFGRQRQNNSFLSRSSWIDLSSEEPSFLTPVIKKKRSAKTNKSSNKTTKSTRQKGPVEDQEKKVRRVVKVPFQNSRCQVVEKTSKVLFFFLGGGGR